MAKRSVIEILLNAKDGASQKIRKVESAAGRLKNAFFSVQTAVAAVASAVVVKFGKDMVAAFNRQERAILRLNQSLANQGKFSEAASEKLLKNASALQKLTQAGDEAILEATGRVAELAGDLSADDLVRVQEAIVGIGDTFFGGDLEQAGLLIGKTIGSSTNALARYGIELDATASQQEKLNAIMAKAGPFFETSKAAASDLMGATTQMRNAFGDLQETLGGVIVESFGLREGATSLKERFIQLDEWVQANRQEIVKWGRVFVASLKFVWESLVFLVRQAKNSYEILVNSVDMATSYFIGTLLDGINKLTGALNWLLEGMDKIPGVDLDFRIGELPADRFFARTAGAWETMQGNLEDLGDAGRNLSDAWWDIAIASAQSAENIKLAERRTPKNAALGGQVKPLTPEEEKALAERRAKLAELREDPGLIAGLQDVAVTRNGVQTGKVITQAEPLKPSTEMVKVGEETPIATPDDPFGGLDPLAGFTPERASFATQVLDSLRTGFDELYGSAGRYQEILNSIATDSINNLGSNFADAFAAIAQGQMDLGEGLKEAFLGSISEMAMAYGKLWTTQGMAALAQGLLGDPRAFAAAAQYFAAAAAAFAVAGAIGGGGGGGGGGAPSARSDVGARQNSLSDTARQEATLVIEGEPILDTSNPIVEDRLVRALEDLSGRRVTVVRR